MKYCPKITKIFKTENEISCEQIPNCIRRNYKRLNALNEVRPWSKNPAFYRWGVTYKYIS